MVRRLLVSNSFCLQDHFSHKEVSHLLISVNQEKHHLRLSEERVYLVLSSLEL